MALYLWKCLECEGHDFHILHQIDTEIPGVYIEAVRVLCSDCGAEFWAMGTSRLMKLVRAEPLQDKKPKEGDSDAER